MVAGNGCWMFHFPLDVSFSRGCQRLLIASSIRPWIKYIIYYFSTRLHFLQGVLSTTPISCLLPLIALDAHCFRASCRATSRLLSGLLWGMLDFLSCLCVLFALDPSGVFYPTPIPIPSYEHLCINAFIRATYRGILVLIILETF